MSLVTVTVPNAKSYLHAGNGTFSKKLPISRECLPCNDGVTSDCPVCTNDTPVRNYATCTGSLFFQFFIVDDFNPNPAVPVDGWGTWLKLRIVTPAGSTLITDMNDVAVNWWVSYVNGQSVQMLELDMAKVCALIDPEKCFYLQIDICRLETVLLYRPEICREEFPTFVPVGTIFFDTDDNILYEFTVSGWVVITPAAGTYVYCQQGMTYYVFNAGVWTLTQTKPPKNILVCEPGCFTEVIKIQRCEDLLFFEADFTTYDCLGFWYGIPAPFVGSAAVPFEMAFYIRGSLETQSFPHEETKSDDESLTLSRKMSEAALLRTYGISKFQAKKIANVFMGESWTVNGETWDTTKDVSKNNDQGENWYPSIELSRDICEKSTTACDE